jgi:hypothetical protein
VCTDGDYPTHEAITNVSIRIDTNKPRLRVDGFYWNPAISVTADTMQIRIRMQPGRGLMDWRSPGQQGGGGGKNIQEVEEVEEVEERPLR